ncbi:MAG: hypothetical protein MJ086_01815 [Lachnospiraceae bacterium]|nr:hypothetical protein [Lachnospiraceae bacterium]
MSNIVPNVTPNNIFRKIQTQDLRIQEEIERIGELNKLLSSNSEIYRLAAYSRNNIREDFISTNCSFQQMDATLEDAGWYLREIQDSLITSIYELMILTKERLKYNLYISKLTEQEKFLLKSFVEECPISVLEAELQMSERTIKRRKQELANRLTELFYSGRDIEELITTK